MIYVKLLAASLILVIAKAQSAAPAQVYGIDFSPYQNGQDPNLNPQISASQILSRMQIVAPYTKWVRSFSSTNGLENIPSVARQLGLRVAANAWISSDTAQNTIEIDNLIAAANAGLVDIAIVGSEAIFRKDVTASQLITYMNQVRQAIPRNIPVTTADVYGTFLGQPALIAASDIIFANFYPYWEGTSVSNAMCSLEQEYQRLVAASGSKQVVISETGWPSAGNAVGAAVPSPANADLFALQFFSWAGANNIPAFYFEAFDEAWKTTYEGPQGAHWGVFDASGAIKPGMNAFFGGQTATVVCNGQIPGPLAINFTYVPPYGSFDALEVQVTGVQPANYVIATYIDVPNTCNTPSACWWLKPTAAQPTVSINPDGTARIAIVTGGTDQNATMIAVFLTPSNLTYSFSPGPPPSITTEVATALASRTATSISGTISDNLGNPISGAVVSDAVLGSTTSAVDGKYSFYQITTGGTATLNVSYPNYHFPASPATVNITAGNQIVNFTGTAAVDLSVISSVSTNPVRLGTNVVETIIASNAGANAASDAVVTVPIPSSFTRVSASTTRGSCTAAPLLVTCDVGGLAATAYATITVVAAPSAAGSFNLSASIAGPDPDANAANNSTSLSLTVNNSGSPLQFVAVAPCRVMDTRNATGPLGGPSIGGGTTRTIPIPASTCGVPSNAQAYSLNVTVVPLTGFLGYLAIWPTGEPQPPVSTLNSPNGEVVANAAIVAAGVNGSIDAFATNDTDLVLDINGYFVPQTTNSLEFYPLTPCRVLDTRNANGTFGGPTLASGSSRSFPIPSGGCGAPGSADAYSFNVTVVPQESLGYLTVWPTGQPQPVVSTLNSPTGTVVANAAMVPAGSAGAVSFYATNMTDLVVDNNGYFAAPGTGGLNFYAVTPCRAVDTRTAAGTFGGPFLSAATSRMFPLWQSSCGIPSTAEACALNVTVVPSGFLGYLTIWPTGEMQPLVSTLNAYGGQVVANAAIVKSCSVNVYVTNSTEVIIDVYGYFQ